MITASAYLALAAAFVVAVAAATLPGALHSLAPYAVAALWAYALWLGRRASKRAYHRHGRGGRTHHLRAPRRRRALLAVRRLRTLRLRVADTTTRTA